VSTLQTSSLSSRTPAGVVAVKSQCLRVPE